MDMWTLGIGFVIGTCGFSVFVFGKRQARPPQLIAGLTLMLLPMVLGDAWSLALAGLAVWAGLVVALRAGH